MYQQTIRRYLKSIILFLIVVSGSCRLKIEPELYLIPDNYEGVVIVLFNQPNGQQERYDGGRRLFDIPPNGVLATRFPKTTHGKLNQVYYYKDNNGNRKTELQPYSGGQGDGNKKYVMNGIYGDFTNDLDSTHTKKYPIHYTMFTIGRIKDKDSLQMLSDGVFKKLIYNY